MKIKIGIIGVCVIGLFLAQEIESFSQVELFAIAEKDEQRLTEVQKKLKTKPKILSIEELIKQSDIIIEAAHPSIVKTILEQVFIQEKKVMVMSIGGLLQCLDLVKKINTNTNNAELHIPTGALGGIDLIKAASQKNIKKVLLQTTKSPKSLGLNNIMQLKTIFEGSVQEAVQKYPQNINIAVTIALAVGDISTVKVKINVDPNIKTNQHEVFIEGDFGKAYFKIENIPSPNNPKTSYLACLSALQKIKEIINKD